MTPAMNQVTMRLVSLEDEYNSGQKMLADLDARRSALTSTLLRIEGAIQVLKELSEQPEIPKSNEAEPTIRSA